MPSQGKLTIMARSRAPRHHPRGASSSPRTLRQSQSHPKGISTAADIRRWRRLTLCDAIGPIVAGALAVAILDPLGIPPHPGIPVMSSEGRARGLLHSTRSM